MIDLNPETVEQIIDRAHQYHTGNSVDGELDDGDLPVDILDENVALPTDEPVYLELKTAIDDLEPDQQVCLVALMWVGRGDYSISEWENALTRAGESWNDHTADYLVRTPLLADYLSEALQQVSDEEV